MEEVNTSAAPAPIGPYSQAIRDEGTLYVSGQGPFDPETGEVISEDISEQTAQTLENLEAILEAGGSSLNRVMQVNIYVSDIDDYSAINEVYERYMSEPYPARAVVEVGEFPVDLSIEVECIAKTDR